VDPTLEKKKHKVVIVYFAVFFTIFITATSVAWKRRIEDARNAKDHAPPTSASRTAPVAPVASR
jgi:hypothetical protein